MFSWVMLINEEMDRMVGCGAMPQAIGGCRVVANMGVEGRIGVTCSVLPDSGRDGREGCDWELYGVGCDGSGSVRGPHASLRVDVGASRPPRVEARRRTTAHSARAGRRVPPCLSSVSWVLFALYWLS